MECCTVLRVTKNAPGHRTQAHVRPPGPLALVQFHCLHRNANARGWIHDTATRSGERRKTKYKLEYFGVKVTSRLLPDRFRIKQIRLQLSNCDVDTMVAICRVRKELRFVPDVRSAKRGWIFIAILLWYCSKQKFGVLTWKHDLLSYFTCCMVQVRSFQYFSSNTPAVCTHNPKSHLPNLNFRSAYCLTSRVKALCYGQVLYLSSLEI